MAKSTRFPSRSLRAFAVNLFPEVAKVWRRQERPSERAVYFFCDLRCPSGAAVGAALTASRMGISLADAAARIRRRVGECRAVDPCIETDCCDPAVFFDQVTFVGDEGRVELERMLTSPTPAGHMKMALFLSDGLEIGHVPLPHVN